MSCEHDDKVYAFCLACVLAQREALVVKLDTQNDALRSRVAELEKALTLVNEFIAEVKAYGTSLKPSEMNVIDKTVTQALKEGAK